MKDYRYIILNVQGMSYEVLKDSEMAPTVDNALPRLLAEGWEPVRETPMGGVGSSSERPNGAFSLILLARERAG